MDPAKAKALKIDERNHVEKPLLDQLRGLKWEVIDLDAKQHPKDTFRTNLAEVVMLPVLREQLTVIQPGLEGDQVDEVGGEDGSSIRRVRER